MSTYDDRLAALRDLAREALDAVVDASGRENEPYGQAVDRLERVVGYAIAALDATQGDLLADPLRNELTAQFDQFNQWGDDHEARANAIAQNAEPWADAVLGMVARLPLARDQDFAQLVSEVAGNYQRSVQEKLNQLDAQFDQEQTRLGEFEAAANAQNAALSEELGQLRLSIDTARADFDQTLTNERTAIEQTKTSQAETFRAAQTERDSAFKAALEDAGHKLEVLLAASNDQVDKSVGQIRRMEEESAALVGAIGLAGTAERYSEEAKQQREAADRWRLVTLALAVIAAAVAVVVAVTLGHNPQWQEFIGKFAAALLIGGGAAYTARQSARHREREERARNFQLELTAFSPFIEPLSHEQQEEERVVMTRKTFGKANTEVSAEEEPGPHPMSFLLRRKERDAG